MTSPPNLDAERLRGAIREAANYAEADEVAHTESGAAILHTLGEALRTDLDDATDRDDLMDLLPAVEWEIVARSMMAKVREIEAWQDSVNRERRKDRARAEAAEFVAHAREDVPALVAYARTLEADNERLRADSTESYEDGYDQGHCDAHADGAEQDRVCRERARAKAAEADRDQLARRLDQVRELVDEWGELGQDVPTRDLRRVLDGDQRKEAP